MYNPGHASSICSMVFSLIIRSVERGNFEVVLLHGLDVTTQSPEVSE